MSASYPTSVKSFTTKNTNDVVQASHVDDLQDEVTAIEQDLIAGLAVARGGTGLTSFTIGDLFSASASGTLAKIAAPAVGQVLTSAGTGTLPVWSGAPALSGLLDLSSAAAGQVKFPAAQNASANANTLDDYEEGTWTPTIGGSGGQSGQAYTTQVGTYVKVGKLVTCHFNVVLSTLGTITTNVQVQGLPFTSQNTSNAIWTMAVGTWAAFSTTIAFLSGILAANATAITLKHIAGVPSTGAFNMVQADLTATTQIVGSITYLADA